MPIHVLSPGLPNVTYNIYIYPSTKRGHNPTTPNHIYPFRGFDRGPPPAPKPSTAKGSPPNPTEEHTPDMLWEADSSFHIDFTFLTLST